MKLQEIRKGIQTETGLYSAKKAGKLYKKLIKGMSNKQCFVLGKKFCIAKWTLPKIIEAIKNDDCEKGIHGHDLQLCGLCFYSQFCFNSDRLLCGECEKRGFSCYRGKYEYDFNSFLDVKQMLKDIMKLKYEVKE